MTAFGTIYHPDDSSMLKQLDEALKYFLIVLDAAGQFKLQPSIIAGVISKESAWGLALIPKGPGGTGDFKERLSLGKYRKGTLPPDFKGFGRGLMQIDYDWHKFAREGLWDDPHHNIMYGCQLISQNLGIVKKKVLTLGNIDIAGIAEGDFLQAALAAYNCGPLLALTAIREGKDIDHFTTNKNYSQQVLDRAGWFRLKGWQ